MVNQMFPVITGIGSRNTPQFILNDIVTIGEWCRNHKIWVRSGHADGADWAFEQGAQEYCLVYLPWVGFNNLLKSNARVETCWPSDQVINLARKFHPKYNHLSNEAKALTNRNGCQILGRNLDKPTNLVICYYTKDSLASGVSGQALRIAKSYGIPILNMFDTTFSQVILALEELLERSNARAEY